MNIEPAIPTSKNPPAQFSGDVWLEHITDDEYTGDGRPSSSRRYQVAALSDPSRGMAHHEVRF